MVCGCVGIVNWSNRQDAGDFPFTHSRRDAVTFKPAILPADFCVDLPIPTCRFIVKP